MWASSTVGNMDEIAATAASVSCALIAPPLILEPVVLSTSEIFSSTLWDSRRPD